MSDFIHLTITEDAESQSTWALRDFISDQLRASVSTADILMVPHQLPAQHQGRWYFPTGSTELFQLIKQSAPELHVEACIEDADYQELARYNELLYIAGFIVSAIAAPVLVNVISDFIQRRMGARTDEGTVDVTLTVHEESDGRSQTFHYEGPASTFESETLRAIIERFPSAAGRMDQQQKSVDSKDGSEQP